MMYWGYGNYSIIGLIIFILVIVLIIEIIAAVLRAIFDTGSRHHHPQPPAPAPVPPTTHIVHPVEKTPLDILKERYAKGEINKEEYEQKRADLTR